MKMVTSSCYPVWVSKRKTSKKTAEKNIQPPPQKKVFKSRPFREKKAKSGDASGISPRAREVKSWRRSAVDFEKTRSPRQLATLTEPAVFCCFTHEMIEICWWQKQNHLGPKELFCLVLYIYLFFFRGSPSLCVHGEGSFYIFIIIIGYKYSELEVPVETAGDNYYPRLNVSRISMSFNSLSLRRHCGRATK